MLGLLKQACPHLLLEHGNQGLESTQVDLCCAKGQVKKFEIVFFFFEIYEIFEIFLFFKKLAGPDICGPK
jgi:hypothetical protein